MRVLTAKMRVQIENETRVFLETLDFEIKILSPSEDEVEHETMVVLFLEVKDKTRREEFSRFLGLMEAEMRTFLEFGPSSSIRSTRRQNDARNFSSFNGHLEVEMKPSRTSAPM